MGYKPTVFNQLFNFIPRHVFDKNVSRLQSDRYAKSFTAWQQFLILLYAQTTGKKTLRDIHAGLQVHTDRLYHLGLRVVPRSTMADGMCRRNSELFESLFERLLQDTISKAPQHHFRFHNPLYSLDATTIDLCLNIYDWAKFRKRKGAIKLHCQLDHAGYIPVFVHISTGKVHDVTAAKEHVDILPDSIYCFDKAYIDYEWLNSINKKKAFFVTRAKRNMDFQVYRTAPVSGSILADEQIQLTGQNGMSKYPSHLRLVTYQDEETAKVYTFLTNIRHLAASTIAAIYKQRWQIEIFFKWIKQNLKIKTFLGTSKNAVMSQIWVALTYYLLLSYIRFLSKTHFNLTETARRMKDALMLQMDIMELLGLSTAPRPHPPDHRPPIQLTFSL